MTQKTNSLRDNGSGSTQTASERAHAELRQRILDGRLPAGSRLKETELASELGISRTPVRDALSRLTVEGLLDFRPNIGATVAVWSATQIENVFRIRAMLEPYASEIAASQILDQEVAELRALCTVMEQAAGREPRDLDKLAAANGRFHRLIIDAARSDHLTKLITIASDAPLSLRVFSRYTPEEVQRSMRHHREIADALAHRDPAWAASAMRNSHPLWHRRGAQHAYRRRGRAASAAGTSPFRRRGVNDPGHASAGEKRTSAARAGAIDVTTRACVNSKSSTATFVRAWRGGTGIERTRSLARTGTGQVIAGGRRAAECRLRFLPRPRRFSNASRVIPSGSQAVGQLKFFSGYTPAVTSRSAGQESHGRPWRERGVRINRSGPRRRASHSRRRSGRN